MNLRSVGRKVSAYGVKGSGCKLKGFGNPDLSTQAPLNSKEPQDPRYTWPKDRVIKGDTYHAPSSLAFSEFVGACSTVFLWVPLTSQVLEAVQSAPALSTHMCPQHAS